MKKNTSTLTRLSAAAGSIAMAATVAATAAPVQAATREGGGIAWPAPTCEIAVRNGTDGPVSVLVESDVHEHPGMVLEWYEGPLVEYTGDYTRSKLLGRMARMPDDSGSIDVPAGTVGSFAIPCEAGVVPDYTKVWVSNEGGDPVRQWNNVQWKGHPHSSEGHVLMDLS